MYKNKHFKGQGIISCVWFKYQMVEQCFQMKNQIMINIINKLSLWKKNMKKRDIQQQISDEQCTAVHNYFKFWFGFGNTRVVPKIKDTKYSKYAVYTVLQAWMHMYKDKSTIIG